MALTDRLRLAGPWHAHTRWWTATGYHGLRIQAVVELDTGGETALLLHARADGVRLMWTVEGVHD